VADASRFDHGVISIPSPDSFTSFFQRAEWIINAIGMSSKAIHLALIRNGG
jgi:hypothetical protein